MIGQALRRLLMSVPVLLGVTFLGFALLVMVPSDPAAILAGDNATPETVARIRTELGLDQPLWQQFVRHLGRLAEGDLGHSIINGVSTAEELSRTIVPTVELSLVALLWAVPAGIALGALAAARRGGWVDRLVMAGSVVGISAPIFMTGLLLLHVVGFKLGLLPTQGRGGPLWTLAGWQHIVLPAFTLGSVLLGPIARMARSSMLEVLGLDYVRLARAKGLSETRVLVRHALRNALVPTVTLVGLQAGYLLGGAVVTETVFAWPGVGRLAVNAIAVRDQPIVQGAILAIALTFVAINLLVDLTCAWLDPRLRR